MRWTPIRDFLRGGYHDINEPTIVASHGRPLFMVTPVNGVFGEVSAQDTVPGGPIEELARAVREHGPAKRGRT